MNKKGNTSIILIIIAVLTIGILFYFKINKGTFMQLKQNPVPTVQPSEQKKIIREDQLKSYTSQDLKISFRYQNGWYIEEEYPFVLISNFESSLHRNIDLQNNQVEIMIKEFSGCFQTLEEDLIDPACGQGKVKNKIISKDVRQTPGGEFLKYTLESYDENQRTQYFFRKGDKILDIEKHPDPSQFEKEFEDLVNSIQFLP
ncbi:hypothetical protein A3G16_01730 [Candidatus Curtissbacteria bacterium RIFCSPLOWO2_12_FULL_41_16]|nr:MAG: hypothetical protein A3G16_01730 [Candidatus Curtissbacteria bacterium RIFCSPLOWO2_12_FULL_41_16]